MSVYDTWLTEPDQTEMTARAKWEHDHTCRDCDVVEDGVTDGLCQQCWAAQTATEIAIARGES